VIVYLAAVLVLIRTGRRVNGFRRRIEKPIGRRDPSYKRPGTRRIYQVLKLQFQ
jgi:hypothetical protein